jgi:hypothetical protein
MPEELSFQEEQMPDQACYMAMKTDLDILLVATRLVEELGDDAARLAKVKLVELIAANNLRAAAFWREVMRVCEQQSGIASPEVLQPRLGAVEQSRQASH